MAHNHVTLLDFAQYSQLCTLTNQHIQSVMMDSNQNIHMNVTIRVTILVLKASNANSSSNSNNKSNHADDNME